MPACFNKGFFVESSGRTWHGLEVLVPDQECQTGEQMFAHGTRTNAVATALEVHTPVFITSTGLEIQADDKKALIALYQSAPPVVVGLNGARYNPLLPEDFRQLCIAATLAGAKPVGMFSLHGGRQQVAVFSLGEIGGVHQYLTIADSFDGSLRLCMGGTSIRVVCANTLKAALDQDGAAWAKIKHTRGLDGKVRAIKDALPKIVAEGGSMASLLETTSKRLTWTQARTAFDTFVPPVGEDASKNAVTRYQKRVTEFEAAMANPINRIGDGQNLATLWNAATFLLDRHVDGSERGTRKGTTRLEAMYGSRATKAAQHLETIEYLVEVMLADGSSEYMSVPEAISSGVESEQLGSNILESMLE